LARKGGPYLIKPRQVVSSGCVAKGGETVSAAKGGKTWSAANLCIVYGVSTGVVRVCGGVGYCVGCVSCSVTSVKRS
jgi:hypothetical protein